MKLQDRQTKEVEIGLSFTDLLLYLQSDYTSPRNLKAKVKVGRFLYLL